MKKVIAIAVLLSLLSETSAEAFYYDAKCMIPEGKLKTCNMDFSKSDSVRIQYKDFQYQGLNREIRGKDIRHISVGEKAKLRWGVAGAAVYALGPLGALTLFWKKKMAMFGLEYRDGNGTDSVLFAVKKKLGFQVSQQLERLSGQTPVFEAGTVGKISKK